MEITVAQIIAEARTEGYEGDGNNFAEVLEVLADAGDYEDVDTQRGGRETIYLIDRWILHRFDDETPSQVREFNKAINAYATFSQIIAA